MCDNRVVREYLGGQDKVRKGAPKYREDGRMWRDKVVGEITSPLATSHQATLQIPVHSKYKLQIQIHYNQVMIKCGIITPITCVCIESGSECQLVDRMQLFHQCNPARLPLVHYSATLVGRNQYFRRAECTHMPGGCLCAPAGGSGLRKLRCSQVSTRSQGWLSHPTPNPSCPANTNINTNTDTNPNAGVMSQGLLLFYTTPNPSHPDLIPLGPSSIFFTSEILLW